MKNKKDLCPSEVKTVCPALFEKMLDMGTAEFKKVYPGFLCPSLDCTAVKEAKDSTTEPSKWVEYVGYYEKRFYDIELLGGEVICNCYPNAGGFHTPDARRIDGKDVRRVRFSKTNRLK